MLGKFTPKQNLNIPPLKYDFVYRLKKDFPKKKLLLMEELLQVMKIKSS